MPALPAEPALDDVFRLGEVLGHGGSATVYAAQPMEAHVLADGLRPGSLSAPIALKVLRPELARTSGAADAFFAEARALQRISHPNVIRMLGYGTSDDSAWIAFERAPGTSLAELVENRGALDPDHAVAVTEGILRGLTAVHAAGLVHRDLSPMNVFVEPHEDPAAMAAGVRLIDFGLSDAPGRSALAADVLRARQASDRDVGVIGSAGYLSTEHALGLPVDERGDLYQVAALLHLMVTGRPPFQRATVAALMRAHAEDPPPLPSVYDSTLPDYIDALVLRGMQKRPEQRFASAAEMRRAMWRRVVTLPIPVQGVPLRRVAPAARVTRATTLPSAPDVSPSVSVPPSSTPRGSAPTVLLAVAGALAAAIGVLWMTGGVLAQPTETLPPPATDAAVVSSPAQPTPISSPRRRIAGVTIPVLVGLSQAAARDLLSASGLRLGTITQKDSASPASLVLSAAPVQGSSAAPGSVVDLVVASGSNAIPDTRGLSTGDASRALAVAGFSISSRTVVDSTVPAATVVGSDPSPEVVVPVGTTVTVLVAAADSAAAPSATPTARPTRTPPPTTAPTRPPTQTPTPGPRP